MRTSVNVASLVSVKSFITLTIFLSMTIASASKLRATACLEVKVEIGRTSNSACLFLDHSDGLLFRSQDNQLISSFRVLSQSVENVLGVCLAGRCGVLHLSERRLSPTPMLMRAHAGNDRICLYEIWLVVR